jgi:hypothetical protein
MPARDDMPPLPWLESSTAKLEPPKPQWQGLRPAQIRLMERTAREAMRAGAYAPAPLDVEPGRLAILWERLRGVPGNLRAILLLIGFALRSRDPTFYGSPEASEILRKLTPAAWTRYPPEFEIPRAPAPALRAPAEVRALPADARR